MIKSAYTIALLLSLASDASSYNIEQQSVNTYDIDLVELRSEEGLKNFKLSAESNP